MVILLLCPIRIQDSSPTCILCLCNQAVFLVILIQLKPFYKFTCRSQLELDTLSIRHWNFIINVSVYSSFLLIFLIELFLSALKKVHEHNQNLKCLANVFYRLTLWLIMNAPNPCILPDQLWYGSWKWANVMVWGRKGQGYFY